jgi:hypothetical protein
MEREKADLMAGLYRLSAASFDYCTPSLPNKVSAFHASFFSLYSTLRRIPGITGGGQNHILTIGPGVEAKACGRSLLMQEH